MVRVLNSIIQHIRWLSHIGTLRLCICIPFILRSLVAGHIPNTPFPHWIAILNRLVLLRSEKILLYRRKRKICSLRTRCVIATYSKYGLFCTPLQFTALTFVKSRQYVFEILADVVDFNLKSYRFGYDFLRHGVRIFAYAWLYALYVEN